MKLIALYFAVFSAGLWATAGLLPLIGVSFAFAILLVNQDLEMFHYVFAAFCFSQVWVFAFKREVVIQGRSQTEILTETLPVKAKQTVLFITS